MSVEVQGRLRRIKAERHYGPGPHPGTGTPQDVHGEGGLASATGARFVMATGDDQDAQLLDWHPESQHVLWISPQDYLDKVAEDMGRAFGERDTRRAVIDEAGVERLKNRMREGKPIDALWVDYELSADQSGGEIVSQEGRHRAWAAIDLGVPYVPVITYFRPEGRGYWDLESNPVDLERVHPWREYLTGDANVERHYGPGPHSGTGTGQDAHAGEDGVSDDDIQKAVARMQEFAPLADETPENASWFGPDGEPMAFGEDHQYTAVVTIKDVEGVMRAEIDAVFKLVEEYGFVRHTRFEGEHGVQLPPDLSQGQRETIVSMMDRQKARGEGTSWHFETVKDGRRADLSASEAASILGLDPDFYEIGTWTIRHMGPGDHPSGSPQEVHAGDDTAHTRDSIRQEIRGLLDRVPDSGNVRSSEVGQRFLELSMRYENPERNYELTFEVIDEVAGNEGFVVRDDQGNELSIQLGEGTMHGGRREIILSWIMANNRGTGMGTDFMNALQRFSYRKRIPLRVAMVTNPDFYSRFDWLEAGERAGGGIREFVYEPPTMED